jgi:hypothetical protein
MKRNANVQRCCFFFNPLHLKYTNRYLARKDKNFIVHCSLFKKNYGI